TLKGVDASKDIDISGLERTPQGIYQITVTPTDVFKPVAQFITIPASGFNTVEVVIDKGEGSTITGGEIRKFFDDRNRSVRIGLTEELNDFATAAINQFARRLGAPHLLDEVILPILRQGDSRIFTAVQDRPWPPWGLGARRVLALCQTHAIADDSYAV